ncbi:hypothetical protein Btru_050075 [Bulinus truncatus]|nr:hypothetical protein Btru_050075 [Bulinus truncatus]
MYFCRKLLKTHHDGFAHVFNSIKQNKTYVKWIFNFRCSCPDGWFGDRCQYACRCVDGCDISGDCLGFPRCQTGWFGPRCQYLDIAAAADASVTTEPPLALYSNWLTDGDDRICNTDPAFMNVTVSWKQEYLITWLRLVAIDPCRNVALKQLAFQSSTYADHGNYISASYAVDGDTLSCSHTNDGDYSPSWTLHFDTPIIARMFLIYNRMDAPNSYILDRLEHFSLVTEDYTGKTVFKYTENSGLALPVHRLIDLKLQPISTVNISTIFKTTFDPNPYLTLCEVEIFEECPPGTWGLSCKNPCPNECQNFCHIDDGTCSNVCVGQSDPPVCTKACRDGWYGVNCSQKCSSNCETGSCSPITGVCSSCLPGYTGAHCDQACRDGWYGVNCSQKCSSNCETGACRPITGVCSSCLPGYTGAHCDQACRDGWYGVNCSQKCSSNCETGSCIPITGVCSSCLPGYTGAHCDQAAFVYNLNCTFEHNLCSWKEGRKDTHDWLLQSGQTLTMNTGPESDHTTTNGKYIYLYSAQGYPGGKAQLISPVITVPINQGCLQFWYSMYGLHVDKLAVYRVMGESNITLWARGGNQGKDWLHAFVDVPAGSNITLIIEATKGTGELGDIAVDDITFTANGICTDEACRDGWYGVNCSQKCSSNCESGTCHTITGVCSSCLPGYIGAHCDQGCDAKYYGKDCLNNCSESCVDELCNPQNGSCFSCFTGRFGDHCDDCPLGTYGDNCKFNCSSYCKTGTGCDPIYGTCYDGN